jgi:DNA invertase Pin-like site-specific DNA recombinase
MTRRDIRSVFAAVVERSQPTPDSPRSTGGVISSLLSNKIESQHVSRLAMVYVRQSSTRQVRENVESTQLQYDLARRAAAYGWPEEQIVTIDDDLGVSGRSLEGRTGFQRLLAEISLNHVGIVMGIEMSRLARNCRDWHQLLELCAVFGSLLGDADGIYNPREHNDRLLLGLKGTMSEAELHVLQGRLDAGRKNKARRGEYFGEVPIGYVRIREGVALDPDQQAQDVVRLLFKKFEELGSANGVLKYFHDHQILIGSRRHNGPQPDEVTWRAASRSTILHLLKHPMYAGAYVFGRSRTVTIATVDGNRRSVQRRVGKEDWPVLLHDCVPAYISWDQWEKNQETLRKNSTQFGFGGARGGSLLTGRIFCGRCGARMAVHYRDIDPYFSCCMAKMLYGEARCQSFNGRWLEPLVAGLVVDAMRPASIQLSLRAIESIEVERERLERHHRQSAERATYKADLARRRYEEVDPANRLVAVALEHAWEAALQDQRRAEEHLNRFRQQTPVALTSEERSSIIALSENFPSLWNSTATSNVERQNLIRILVDRIEVDAVNGTERLSVIIHWSGGFTSHHESRRSVQNFEDLEDSAALIRRAQQLYDLGYSEADIVQQLNHEGFHPARNKVFTKTSLPALKLLLRRRGLISDRPKLPENFWRATQLASELNIGRSTLTQWRHRRWVQATAAGSRWIYWADEKELKRLRQLTSSHVNGHSHPKHLTTPSSTMPDSLTTNPRTMKTRRVL